MVIYQNRNGTAFIKNDEIIETKKKKRKNEDHNKTHKN